MSCSIPMSTAPACLTFAAGGSVTVLAHYEYAKDAAGGTIIRVVRYTDSAGVPITLGTGDTVAVGACPVAPVIIASGSDNEWVIYDDGVSRRMITVEMDTSTNPATPIARERDGSPVGGFDPSKIVVPSDGCECTPATPLGVQNAWGT
jgi:hypothetical protein